MDLFLVNIWALVVRKVKETLGPKGIPGRKLYPMMKMLASIDF